MCAPFWRIALLLALAVAAVPLPAQDLPALLEGLAKHQDAVRPVYDAGFTMTTRTEELDKKGRAESTTESVERITTVNGKQEREIVRAVRDGKDVTQEQRRRRAERKAAAAKAGEGSGSRRNLTMSVFNPFARDEQAKYRFTLAGADPAVPGGVLIRFEPKGAPSDQTNTGEAVVDTALPAPVRIRYRPSVTKKPIQKIAFDLLFATPSPRGPVLSSFSIEGEGGVLFVKKRFRSKTTFSDYSGAR
ncbi:MAG: hypothetical protein H7X85_01005 [Thermoanaerobaculia bacterium]|nr:hypothetical protein [Thermoanaerobaculia bacterium]